MCWGYQKLEGQTGEWKLHQVLLIPRCSLVLRKSVSCRLLGTGKTHQGTSLHPTLCLCSPWASRQQLTGPGGPLVWIGAATTPGSAWGCLVSLRLGDFSGHPKREMDCLQRRMHFCLWIFFCGQSHLDGQMIPDYVQFGGMFSEIWIQSRVIIQSWKCWKKPRDHLIHSFALIQD